MLIKDNLPAQPTSDATVDAGIASQSANTATDGEFERNFERLKSELATNTTKTTELTTQLATMEDEVAKLKAALATKDRMNAGLWFDLETKGGIIAMHKATIARHEATIATHEATIATHEATIATKDATLAGINNQVAKLADEVALGSQTNSLPKQGERLHGEEDELTVQVPRVEADTDVGEHGTPSMTDGKDTKAHHTCTIKTEGMRTCLEEAQARADRYELLASTWHEARCELEYEVDSLEEQVFELNDEVTELKDQVAALQDELAALKAS